MTHFFGLCARVLREDSFRLQRSLWFTGSVGRGKAKRSAELIYETKRNHKTQLPHSINRLSVEIRRKSNVEGDNRLNEGSETSLWL